MQVSTRAPRSFISVEGHFENFAHPKLSKFWLFIVSSIVSLTDIVLIGFPDFPSIQFLRRGVKKTRDHAAFSWPKPRT